MSKLSGKNIRSGAATIASAVILSATASTASAQQDLGILGVDHVGINVPDMKQAVQFFEDVLGFTPVTQIGPIALDSNWKKANHMHPGTGPVTLKMVRTGTGANIELFEYQDNKGSAIQPGGDDLGATHIAFYTSDISKGVEYLKSKGVKVMGDPFHMTAGDTEGETWVYFVTPWGYKMELVSYPNGKGYEKHNPKTLLWSPKDYASTSQTAGTTLSETQIKELIDQHLAIWNEHDAAKRKALLDKVYATDIEMVDRHFIANGTAAINSFVEELQSKNPTFHFSHIKAIEINHNIARLYWQFGTKAKPDTGTGMDLFVIENGKIKKLYVFVDQK